MSADEAWAVAVAAWAVDEAWAAAAQAVAGFGPRAESKALIFAFARNAVTVNRTNEACPACRKNVRNVVRYSTKSDDISRR